VRMVQQVRSRVGLRHPPQARRYPDAATVPF